MLDQYDPRNLEIAWDELAVAAVALAITIAIALVIHWIAFRLLRRFVRISETTADDELLLRIKLPLRWLAVAIAVGIVAHSNSLVAAVWDAAARFVVPGIIGWLALSAVRGFAAALELRTEETVDHIAARSRKTRIAIFSRTASFVIVIITIALILIGIPGVREIGVTMMASAGLLALAVGAAAQPALKSLISGLQMALTEPIRIGDMVVIDGHTGRVEEIRMSYVLVRIWDERLVIVPTSRFLEQTFENWSRTSEKLTGPIFLHLDPITDIAPIRAEFERWAAANPLWDKRTATAQVTDAHPESVELRLTVSAHTIGDLWNLRCQLREHILAWLRENMPDALIRRRLEVEAANERAET
ncbi:small mechanosensitive ion channel protein MscS [Aurantiacibacter atlanticus]|uniref:Small mechanosensitive ion channel protein MscS n=1 Tax=Aurantiacibacter atlanticus TaxID=1648404 RepID=A0A0H4V9X5_9SPHN|nr:mechanosensitive ion channel domain-containing protein [Aurantiacibacter atlanticus]AKQ41280.1 small mechanosensitive ion channel protein MscS [Aurantiacibacter atlanticus]